MVEDLQRPRASCVKDLLFQVTDVRSKTFGVQQIHHDPDGIIAVAVCTGRGAPI